MATNKKYIITFPKQNATAICEYNNLGHLIDFSFNPGIFEKEHYDFFFKAFPKNMRHINYWKTGGFKNVQIREVEPDVSFDNFYNKYNHKVSKRKTAEAIWNNMDDINKAKAINFIPQYERHLIMTGVNKKYPETYLNSEMWNN